MVRFYPRGRSHASCSLYLELLCVSKKWLKVELANFILHPLHQFPAELQLPAHYATWPPNYAALFALTNGTAKRQRCGFQTSCIDQTIEQCWRIWGRGQSGLILESTTLFSISSKKNNRFYEHKKTIKNVEWSQFAFRRLFTLVGG